MNGLLEKLSKMVAADTEPTLSTGEIVMLIDSYKLVDADGIAPDEVGWTPTYNLRAAACEGWRWKMGKCSDLVSTDLDGDRMSSNQMFEHCERMVRKYATVASPSIAKYNVDMGTFFSE
ncbi:MAG TPA: hypothetical protein PLD38_15690 [Pyrinomonadaceae bacterium]|nr:hypothetical protein [Pyrinomonadaceae bacterium]